MLRALVERSIQFRGVVIVLALVMVCYGIYVARHSKFDVFPEFAPPQVVIQTEAPGLSSEGVEVLVTTPVENAVNGVANLETTRSHSIQGLSVITIVFREGTDVFTARQMISERLVEVARQLPEGIHPPTMTPFTSATSTIFAVGLTSHKRTSMELRTFADWTMRPRLLGVPGVAKVTIFGGDVRQIQIQVIPDKLIAYGLSLSDVLAAARQATSVRGAGFIDTDNQRVVIRTEGQAVTAEDVAKSVIVHEGNLSVRLADVAHVIEAGEPKVGDALIQGESGVILMVSSQFRANTQEVSAGVEQALAEMKPAIAAEDITLHPPLFRPAKFIETAIGNINFSLLLGGTFVAIVLFIFLFNVRTGFISLTAIPLSLLAAVIVLDLLGVSLNTLTLGGLGIAIGEVVDDAIIDVENIFRRLRENRHAGSPKPAFRVVLDASIEVRSAVIYATFIVVIVFVPVFTMTGIQGRLFSPLGLAYVLAVLASLLVALTLTPALSYVLLAQSTAESKEARFVTALKTRYLRVLDWVGQRPKRVIGAVFVQCVAAAATIPLFGGAFLPELREGHFIVHMSAVPGTSLQESLRLGREVTTELLKNPHIRSVAQKAGRAEKADDIWGTHYSEFHVDLQPLKGEEAEFVQAEIREALAKFSGVSFAVKPFLTERIEETISGVTAEVVIKIFGNDLDMIDLKAREVSKLVGQIEGAVDVQMESQPGSPEMVVRLKPSELQRFGMKPAEVLDTIQAAYQGVTAAQSYRGNQVSDVVVILDDSQRKDPEAIGSLTLRAPDGGVVLLKQIADVFPTTGRYVVLHDGARRRQAVTCNVQGRDLASFTSDMRQKILNDIVWPPGVYPVFGGTAETRIQAQGELMLHSLIAGAGIVLILFIVFGNIRNLLLILANLPFALVGGVLAVFFTGGWLSVGSLVGFVTLFGITTRNSIMMISHYDHLVTQEYMVWGEEAAWRGASERLLPILMTALVTALGLLPLAIGSGEPGREIEGPMAIVILGGLITSTTLNLLVLPTLALRYGRFKAFVEG